MRTTKVISKTGRSINLRFFQALQKLMDRGEITSLEAFCRENGLSRPKYSEFRKEYLYNDSKDYASRYKMLDYEAIYALVTKHRVSCEWLIVGSGKMLKEQEKTAI
jgi:hypothetical protein